MNIYQENELTGKFNSNKNWVIKWAGKSRRAWATVFCFTITLWHKTNPYTVSISVHLIFYRIIRWALGGTRQRIGENGTGRIRQCAPFIHREIKALSEVEETAGGGHRLEQGWKEHTVGVETHTLAIPPKTAIQFLRNAPTTLRWCRSNFTQERITIVHRTNVPTSTLCRTWYCIKIIIL